MFLLILSPSSFNLCESSATIQISKTLCEFCVETKSIRIFIWANLKEVNGLVLQCSYIFVKLFAQKTCTFYIKWLIIIYFNVKLIFSGGVLISKRRRETRREASRRSTQRASSYGHMGKRNVYWRLVNA